MSKRILALILGSTLFASACGTNAAGPSAVSAPATPQAQHVIDYNVYVPFPFWLQVLQQHHPTGITIAPATAQQQWDFSCEYQGTLNVYAGPVAPPSGTYLNMGILVAPFDAANHDTFTVADWPAIGPGLPPSMTFTWSGHFVYAEAGYGTPPYGICAEPNLQ